MPDQTEFDKNIDLNELSDEEQKEMIKHLKKQVTSLESLNPKNVEDLNNLNEIKLTLGFLYANFPEYYDDALNIFLELVAKSHKHNFTKLQLANLYGSIASINYAKKDYANASIYYKNAIDNLEAINSKEIMISKKGLGLSLIGLGEFQNGVKLLLESAEMAVDLSDINNYMDIVVVLKTFYAEREDWESVIELEKKALKILETYDNNYEIFMSHIELGLAYSKLKLFEEALRDFKLAVNSAIKEGNNILIYQGLILVAESYLHLKRFNDAKREYLQALSMAIYMKNQDQIIKTKLILSNLGTSKEELEQAEKQAIEELKKPKKIKT